ncbi:MAG: type II toxin-antitoxin system VapC family toxin [Rhizobiaceae bacterium]|nr:type II toxin-antitoxin system VapC family toxin [Rhizobiaceae bacterium]
MIVDASALLAILLDEPERMEFREKIAYSQKPEISPVNYLEVCLRVDRGTSPELADAVDPLMSRLGVGIAAIGPEQAMLARHAYRTFGKGSHPARLNLGDCFAYALAKARGEPLLFKGEDFRHTDVEPAI